jgi:hypothetical protein
MRFQVGDITFAPTSRSSPPQLVLLVNRGCVQSHRSHLDCDRTTTVVPCCGSAGTWQVATCHITKYAAKCDGIPHHLGNRAACDAANAYGQTSLITCFSKHFWDGYRGVIGCCSSSSSSSFSPCLDVFTTIAVMDRALTHLHCLRASSVTDHIQTYHETGPGWTSP